MCSSALQFSSYQATGLIYVQVGAYKARDKACDVACQLMLKGYKPMIKVKK